MSSLAHQLSRLDRSTIAAGALAACLTVLTVGKLLSPGATLAVLERVWRLPDGVAQGSFVVLIAAEGLLIALLLIRTWRPTGFVATALFLLAVSVSPLRQLIEGSTLGCGCGGRASADASWLDHGLVLGRNMLLALLATLGLVEVGDRQRFVLHLSSLYPFKFLKRWRSECHPTRQTTISASPDALPLSE